MAKNMSLALKVAILPSTLRHWAIRIEKVPKFAFLLQPRPFQI
ncbi:UNVERIFIED_CONTAM: hypothetical protein GTU68_023444 [Idotea baltica]|nr:hypothetical protein [Idotea baltica]